MLFPRPTIRVGECLALDTLTKGGIPTGKPRTCCRPITLFRGEKWRASRVSYCLNHEEIPRIPESLKWGLVLHSCDNEWCIEPKHLSLGTQKQNIKDAWERNPDYRQNLRIALLGNSNAKGKKWSEEAKAAKSRSLMGNDYAKGKKHKPKTPEQIERLRAAWTPERKKDWSERMMGNDYKRKA